MTTTDYRGATVCTDEDGTIAFVLIDPHAPDEAAALNLAAWAAREEWGMVFAPTQEQAWPTPDQVKRGWYKWQNEETLVGCTPDDPDRDSEWWSLVLPPAR